MSDLAAKNAHDVAWEVVERPDMAPADRNKVFLRRIMETPRIYQVWYEPGYVYPRHQHPVDEIFYILRGDFTINGHDLREGSMIYVPKNTKYGPEHTGKDGVLFLRVELWDTEEGPPGSQARGVNIKAWTGGETADGLPDVPGPKAAPTPDEPRSLETAEATRSVSAADRPWLETTREMSDRRPATTSCLLPPLAPAPRLPPLPPSPRHVPRHAAGAARGVGTFGAERTGARRRQQRRVVARARGSIRASPAQSLPCRCSRTGWHLLRRRRGRRRCLSLRS